MVQMSIMSLEPVLTELHNLPVNMMKVSAIQRTYTQMTKPPSPKCHRFTAGTGVWPCPVHFDK